MSAENDLRNGAIPESVGRSAAISVGGALEVAETGDDVLVDAAGVWENMNRLRWLEGEKKAISELDLHSATDGLYDPVEIVGLGFLETDLTSDGRPGQIDWVEMENIAENPTNTFTVNGQVVHDLLKERGTKPHVVWHSHFKDAQPSRIDVEFFPSWLVGVGMVFCARTDTSSLYDQDGIICQVSHTAHSPLATQDK